MVERIQKQAFKEAAEGPRLVRRLSAIHTLGIGPAVRRTYARWYRFQINRQWTHKNAEALRRFRSAQPALTPAGGRVLDSLHARGWAAAPVTDFVSVDRWAALKALVEVWVSSEEVQTLERAYIEGRTKQQKPYLVRMFGRDAAFDWNSPWVQVGIEPSILGVVNSYLDLFSTVRYIDVWDTVPKVHDGPDQASQLWHRDPEDRRLVKTFLYFTDVDASAGALQYVPHSRPGERYGHLWPQQYPAGVTLKPSELESQVPPSEWVTCAFPAGTLLFVDTVGFHRGGRATRTRRVLATWAYASPASPWPRAFTVVRDSVPSALKDSARFALMLDNSSST